MERIFTFIVIKLVYNVGRPNQIQRVILWRTRATTNPWNTFFYWWKCLWIIWRCVQMSLQNVQFCKKRIGIHKYLLVNCQMFTACKHTSCPSVFYFCGVILIEYLQHLCRKAIVQAVYHKFPPNHIFFSLSLHFALYAFALFHLHFNIRLKWW